METSKQRMKMFWTLFVAVVLATGRPGAGVRPLPCVDHFCCLYINRTPISALNVFVLLFYDISPDIHD